MGTMDVAVSSVTFTTQQKQNNIILSAFFHACHAIASPLWVGRHVYLEVKGFLSNKQFGFRTKSSTHHAVTKFSDSIRQNMEKGLMTGALFIDLRKAFIMLVCYQNWSSMVLETQNLYGSKNISSIDRNLLHLKILNHHPK